MNLKVDLTLNVLTRQNKTKHKDIWEVMNMFSTLVIVMVSQVYTYVQTHQDVDIQCVQLFVKARMWGRREWGRENKVNTVNVNS